MTALQPKSRFWLFALAALVAVLLAGVGGLQYAQWKQFEDSLSEGSGSIEWDIFQFQAEHYKLIAKIDQTLQGEGRDDSMADLGLRYSVYLSRYDIVRNGKSSRAIETDAAYVNSLASIAAFIHQANDYLGNEDQTPSYDAAQLKRLRRLLEATGEPVQTLVLTFNRARNVKGTAHLQALRRQAVISGASSVALAMVAVGFGLIALRQLMASRRRNLELEVLHRKLEEALEHAQQASLAKSQFLANMSHEIRTPMNAIFGMLRLLQNTGLNVRQLDYAAKMEGAARSLLGLINSILDFSKIEAGKMSLDPRPFCMEQMLRDLSVVLSANLIGKPLELRFDVDPAVPAALLGDDMRLQQVLINLGGNAIKFTAQGEVVLGVRVVERGAHDVLIDFSVRDTGIGIAPENQGHIFSGFSQAEANTTRRFGGTGLGLAISMRLVALLGGVLQLKSTLGQGSTFFFQLRLPVAALDDVKSPSSPATTGIVKRLSGMRILVVEDNAINQMVADGLLSQEGAQVTLANNGLLGVEAVAAAPTGFDAVLMDIQMPEMDGYAATHAIRTQLGLTQLPIIAMTANAMESDRVASLNAGMNEHVGKPFELDHLVGILLGVTGRPAGEATLPLVAQTVGDVVSLQERDEMDVVGALARLGGNVKMFAQVLQQFSRELEGVSAKVSALLEDGVQGDAVRALHTLKGLSATVGAHRLSTVAAGMERELVGGLPADGRSAFMERLNGALERTATALLPILEQYVQRDADSDSRTAETLDTVQIIAKLEVLRELLTQSDLMALEQYSDIRRMLGNAAVPMLDPLDAAMVDLEFELSVQRCDDVIAQLESARD